MQKTRKFSKSTLAVLALSIVLAVSLIVGATFAWFKANVSSGSSTVTTGRLTVGLAGYQGDGTTAATDGSVVLFYSENEIVVPGEVIDVQEVDATFGTEGTLTNIATLLRMKVNFTGDKLGDATLTGSLTGFNDEFSQLEASDGWYYYTAVIAPNTASIDLITDGTITVPTTYTTPDDQNKTLTISLDVQICQADWTTGNGGVFSVSESDTPAEQAAAVAAVFAVTYPA